MNEHQPLAFWVSDDTWTRVTSIRQDRHTVCAEGFGKECGYLSKHLSNYNLFDVAGLPYVKKCNKNVRKCVFRSLTVARKVETIKSITRVDAIKRVDFYIGDGEHIEFEFWDDKESISRLSL